MRSYWHSLRSAAKVYLLLTLSALVGLALLILIEDCQAIGARQSVSAFQNLSTIISLSLFAYGGSIFLFARSAVGLLHAHAAELH